MSDENKIPNDSKEEKTEISGNKTKITIKKSTYDNLLIAIVITISMATFFGDIP